MSNNAMGKKAESFALHYLESLGKDVYVTRLVDTFDANKGRWGDPAQKKVIIPRRPSDFIIVMKGRTFFCDIKSTSNVYGLTASLFNEQIAERTRITRAGGEYVYLIYSYAHSKWYWIPFTELDVKAKWEDLEKFFIDIPKVPL